LSSNQNAEEFLKFKSPTTSTIITGGSGGHDSSKRLSSQNRYQEISSPKSNCSSENGL